MAPPDALGGLRYEPVVKVASGGMATVFLGALRGPYGFRQLVAIKRPHQHLVDDPQLCAALLAEARLAARIHHPNVVDIRDIEVAGDVVQLVMDYVPGSPLGALLVAWGLGGPRIPAAVGVRIVLDAAAGLHAAHELRDDVGAPLGVVHRDVSPQNLLVGVDGVARVTDFGIAKSLAVAEPSTAQGTLKGKVGYMAPEYIRGKPIDRRVDVFALGVVFWEVLAGKRLFRGANEADTIERVCRESPAPPSQVVTGLGRALDEVVARTLAKDPNDRFPTTEAFAEALEAAARPAGLVATHAEVARFVDAAVGPELERRRRLVLERLDDGVAARAVGDAPAASPDVEPREGERTQVIGEQTTGGGLALQHPSSDSGSGGRGLPVELRAAPVASAPSRWRTRLLPAVAAGVLVSGGIVIGRWRASAVTPVRPTSEGASIAPAASLREAPRPTSSDGPTPLAATSDAGAAPSANPGAEPIREPPPVSSVVPKHAATPLRVRAAPLRPESPSTSSAPVAGSVKPPPSNPYLRGSR